MTATEEISKGATLAGRYRVLRRIGTGGMATVFLAEDERLGREVAIKRLHTDAPKASLRRFRREAKLGAALNHPGFVAVYDTVITEEGALIVMEHVPGSSLAELAGGRRMQPKKALPILRSVAGTLDHAHEQGVVHRDVKPANILVREDGVVKLADLGIARAIGATQITSEGSVVGTLPYMAPERLAGPGAGGPESDVFALAAVAYELFAGRPPSEPTSAEQAAAAPPPDLGRHWPQAPDAAVSALKRGLDPDPALRPASAGRLVDELESGLGERSEAETQLAPTSVQRPLTEAIPAIRVPAGPRRWLAIGALAVALAAIAGIALAGGGGGSAEESGGGSQQAEGAGDQQQPQQQGSGSQQGGSADPAELNDRGFELINQGRYEEAIPLLERAVAAYPEGSQDLTYAFALFNLGHALRMAGRPEEAIPILERRLEIPNQRDVVERELELAIAAAGGEDDEDEGPGRGNGKGKDKDKDKD